MPKSSFLLTLLLGPALVAYSAGVVPVVAPLNNQKAIRGCAWSAWISPQSSPHEIPAFIFIADRDDSKAVMNIDGADVVLKVEGKSGALPNVGDVIKRRYSAPGIEVMAIYTVTSDCSKSTSESCEASGYSVNLQVIKSGRTQIIDAKGEVGC